MCRGGSASFTFYFCLASISQSRHHLGAEQLHGSRHLLVLRPGFFLIFTKHPGSSFWLMSTMTSMPLAITSAWSPYRASSASASRTVFGSK
jgi:hypothetical protein